MNTTFKKLKKAFTDIDFGDEYIKNRAFDLITLASSINNGDEDIMDDVRIIFADRLERLLLLEKNCSLILQNISEYTTNRQRHHHDYTASELLEAIDGVYKLIGDAMQ
ncbi:MAG: hypothetical protein IJR44_04565 [Neisseriaceae bacterium]|nr:hypothetical protein [Neisseriaceae bacterium]